MDDYWFFFQATRFSSPPLFLDFLPSLPSCRLLLLLSPLFKPFCGSVTSLRARVFFIHILVPFFSVPFPSRRADLSVLLSPSSLPPVFLDGSPLRVSLIPLSDSDRLSTSPFFDQYSLFLFYLCAPCLLPTFELLTGPQFVPSASSIFVIRHTFPPLVVNLNYPVGNFPTLFS